MSTQEGFGRILYELAGGDSQLSRRIVTTSPDVSVSTNLGGWVNRRGIFDRRDMKDIFKEEKIVSAQLWQMGHQGQHVELGIAEHNLFLMLGALGLSADLFGARLLPIGTVYDPFIARGLDALNYACYQDARFMIVATPSGLTLAPEGGAHQSIIQPLIGLGQPGLTSFEPAHVDELAEIIGEEDTFSPELREVLLIERNRNWIPEIEKALATERDVMFLVGAAHLVGEESVVALLRRKGLEVTQLAASDR
jgi:pyruvate dehydrogenase E1 component